MQLRAIFPLALLAFPLWSSPALADLIAIQGIDQIGPISCPNGAKPETVGKGTLCVRNGEVVGPFTEGMVGKCLAIGGGTECHEPDGWPRDLAVAARGDDVCPRGAVWDPVTTYCIEQATAYGPFPAPLVTRCHKAGGGDACNSARWSRDFLFQLMGKEARTQFASPLPVECGKGWTWMALGLQGGGLCVSGEHAMGPFSKAMINRCIAIAGESCSTAMTWSRDLAAGLHGHALCPPGTALDDATGHCGEEDDVFGPFPASLVDKCKAEGGGNLACQSARWGREFLMNLRGIPREMDPFLAFQLPEPSKALATSIKTLWATNYYLPVVDAVSSGVALRNRDGLPLGPLLTKRDWCNAAMEGSVYVRTGPGSGRTYNYDGTTSSHRVDCSHMFSHGGVGSSKFRVARGQYGDGVGDYRLFPFRTIAVDPSVIPYGTLVYVPRARGLSFKLPDGRQKIHDGFFFAADTGGAIHGNHIDVFTGTQEKDVFPWIESRSRGTFEAWILGASNVKAAFEKAHLP